MKKNITSHNTQAGTSFRDFVSIDSPQILLDLTIAILILLSFNVPTLLTRLLGSGDASYTSLGDYVKYLAPWLYNFFDSPFTGRAIQMLLWLFIGCVAYIIIWFFGSFLTSLRNDVVADSYLHPKSYNRPLFWVSVLSPKAVFVCLCTILLVFLYAVPNLLFQLSVLSYESIIDFTFKHSLVYLAGSIVTSVISVHLFFILIKLISRNWKIIYSDL